MSDRQRLKPAAITCWTRQQGPTSVQAIEIDSRGARLVLPWSTVPGECVRVSLADELGQFRTTRARVVWTKPLKNTNRVVAGLSFEEEVYTAA